MRHRLVSALCPLVMFVAILNPDPSVGKVIGHHLHLSNAVSSCSQFILRELRTYHKLSPPRAASTLRSRLALIALLSFLVLVLPFPFLPFLPVTLVILLSCALALASVTIFILVAFGT